MRGLVRLAVLSLLFFAPFGCSRTQVLYAPHASPGRMAAGTIEVQGGLTRYAAKGLIAVSEVKRGDLVWRLERAGKRIDLCRGDACEQAEAAPGSKLPRSRMKFLETTESRPASSRAGAWLTGGFVPYLYYCWLEGDQPLCEQLKIEDRAVLAFNVQSTHSIIRGGDIEDVIWVSIGTRLTRCYRSNGRSDCKSIFVDG